MAGLGGVVDELRDAAFELDAAVSRSGLVGKITSGYRSHSEQARLYRAYISGRHAFPVAPPGHSAHEYGWAFDYVVAPADYQSDVGALWQSWGGVWGGRRDRVHFELPGASQNADRLGNENPYQDSGFLNRGLCDWSDWKSYVFWSPSCACAIVDALKGSFIAGLIQLGWDDVAIVNLLASPCTTVLQKIRDLGI